MQFQIQTLVFRDAAAQTEGMVLTQREADDLDLFVGLNTAITSPYNLFLRVSDVQANSSMIYFYAYSLGREKVMLWGIYDTPNNEFLVDNNCIYDVNDLDNIIKIWQNHAYQFSSSSQKDMMTMNLRQHHIYSDVKYQRELAKAFRLIFYANLVYDGGLNLNQIKFLVQASDPKINKASLLQNEVSRLIVIDVQGVYESHLSSAVHSGQQVLNMIYPHDDDYPAYMNLIDTMIKHVYAESDRTAIRSRISRSGLIAMPTRLQIKLSDLIIATVYLMTFSDFEEYKAAKLLMYLYDESKRFEGPVKKNQIQLYLKGTFLYEWLLHIAGSFKVYDIEEFMFDTASCFVLFTENKINNNSGVIGLGAIGLNFSDGLADQLERISTFFEQFIAKSIYSKSSYTKEFQPCPMIKTCQNDKCDLIFHGVGNRQSRHDLT